MHTGSHDANDPAVWRLTWRRDGQRYMMLLSSPDGVIVARGAQRLAAIIASETDVPVEVEVIARFCLDELEIG